jgi:hypothetical protein
MRTRDPRAAGGGCCSGGFPIRVCAAAGGSRGGHGRETEGSRGGGKTKRNVFFRLPVALVGNYLPTPCLGSYLMVSEQRKRCSKTPPSNIAAPELTTPWSFGVGVFG